MKYNKIVITSQNVVGSKVNSSKIINLSSLPNALLRALLTRIPSFPEKYHFISLTNSTILSHVDKRKIHTKGKKLSAVFVVDADDNYRDIKMMNVCKMAHAYVATVIVIGDKTKHKIKTSDTQPIGHTIKIANWHHDDDVLTQLGAFACREDRLAKCDFITVVKTNDALAGSIGAIMVFLSGLGQKVKLEKASVVYNKTWLIASLTGNDTFKLQSDGVADDVLINANKYWTYRSGYTSYVMTTKGPKKFIIDTAHDNTRNSWYSPLINMIRRIKEAAIDIWNTLMMYFSQYTQNKDASDTTDMDTNDGATVAFSIIHEVPEIACHVASIIMCQVPKNAKKDIKLANKLVTKMQLNKMLTRTGAGGDKTLLNDTHSDAFNSYVAGITSYNVNDSLIMANNEASSKYRGVRMILLMVVVVLSVTSLLIVGSKMSVVLVGAVAILNHFTNIFKDNLPFYLISLLCSHTFLGSTLSAIMLLAEMSISDNDTRLVRSCAYLFIKCLFYLVW